jgi:hypothetical protein
MQVSEKCAYYNNKNIKVSYAQKFYYYLNNNHEELEKICVNFHSTNQIKTWISNTLTDLYNDIDLYEVTQVSSKSQSSPNSSNIQSKYDSVKRRISSQSINEINNSIV